MNLIKIVNVTNNKEIVIKEPETVIGRGDFLECDDKRISRQHAIIKISNDIQLNIQSTHSNPIFYTNQSDQTIKTIWQGSDVLLQAGDRFGLLPDNFWFTIKIDSENDDNNNPDKQNTDQIEPVTPNEVVQNSNDTQEYHVSISGPERTVATKRRLPDWMSKSDGNEVVHNTKVPKINNSVSANPVKVEDDVPDSDNQPSTSSGVTRNQQQIKQEPAEDVDSSSVVQPLVVSVKTVVNPDPIDSSSGNMTDDQKTKKSEADSSTGDIRESCRFGIRCYRLNPIHRREAAHPGDSDYRRPDYPPPPLDAPPCPFGDRCYRRNPIHFQSYSHPPSTNPKLNRQLRREERKCRKNVNYTKKLDYGVDDDSEEDPFIDSENSKDSFIVSDETETDLNDTDDEEI